MEENKRKQYAHLYEHHEVEDPQPREEKEKPIGPSGRNRHRPMVEKVCRRIAFSFLAMAVVLLLALNYFQIKEAKKEAVLEYKPSASCWILWVCSPTILWAATPTCPSWAAAS